MASPATVAVNAPRVASDRRLGVDVARLVAIAGMLVAHYTYLDGTGGPWRAVHRHVDGRAMPLFVLLGGVGFTLLTRRAAHPVAEVLGRAAFLLALGLLLVEHVPLIAVIIQFYALFFILALPLRRLPGPWLLALAGAVTLAGGLTWLFVAPGRAAYPGWEGWATIADPRPLLLDLTLTGYYPVLPVFAFFLVGMWVGRLDLGRPGVAVRLTLVGAALAVLGYAGGEVVMRATVDRSTLVTVEGRLQISESTASAVGRATGVDAAALARRADGEVATSGEPRRVALRRIVREHERRTEQGRLARLADPAPHGEMPAWVVGATGTSVAVLGMCLLATGRWPRAMRPLAAAGAMALTFYVLHALGLRWWYDADWARSHTYVGELVVCAVIGAGLVLVASAWTRVAPRGPLEMALRGSGRLAGGAAARLGWPRR